MQANWSIILNVLLLIGVIVAISRLMRARKQSLNSQRYQPSLGAVSTTSPYDAQPFNDDIIAVRKLNRDEDNELVPTEEFEADLIPKPVVKSVEPKVMLEDDSQEEARINARVEQKKAISSMDPLLYSFC